MLRSGFQEANVDAYSWATKVMVGLIRMVPEHVEAGFLVFLLSRIVGVMKEDSDSTGFRGKVPRH
jgi:hypothetical protein